MRPAHALFFLILSYILQFPSERPAKTSQRVLHPATTETIQDLDPSPLRLPGMASPSPTVDAPTPSASVSTRPTPSPSQTPGPSSPVDTIDYLNDGLHGAERHQYRTLQSFSEVVDKYTPEFLLKNPSQHVVFSDVTTAQLKKIEGRRHRYHKGLRFFHLKNENVLIVKTMPGAAQEIAHLTFDEIFAIKKLRMGLLCQLLPEGSIKYIGSTGTKEADRAHRPVSSHHRTDWPTVVYECGFSQSLARLVVDAHWWLETTGGEVKIAIIITIDSPARKLHLEKWEGVSRPNSQVTQANPNASAIMAMKICEVDIFGTDVRGAPLELQFEKVMNRKPGNRREGDFVFTSQDFESYARAVWGVLE